MKWNALLLLVLIVFSQSVSAQKAHDKKDNRPNIIIIMADDLGYSDPGCYGGEIHTPHLDRLAKNGMRLNNFYNNARCCPTRASLLTGQYAHKVGLAMNGNALTRNGATIAELLKEHGYQTGMVGKWHLSDDIQQPTKEAQLKWLNHQAYTDSPFASLNSYPVNRGFQQFYGVIWGVVNYFDPFSLVEGASTVKEVPKDYYITDAISERSVAYIKQFTHHPPSAAEAADRSAPQPYFLYLAYTAPHWPVHARPEDLAKYKRTYEAGWDELRKQRYQRMVKLGLIDTTTTPLLPVMGGQGSWDQLSAVEKEKQALKMATHAAMIDRLDKGVGEIIQTLEQTNTLQQTIIIFLADNGASPEIPPPPGYDRPSQTRQGIPLQYDKEVTNANIGREISYTGIGPNWANASNTPYRYWKMESFEGGAHTPMIIHWPAGLTTRKGVASNALGHVTDLLPTLLDIVKFPYPASYQGNVLTPLDGQSLLPVWKGKNTKGRERIFFEHANGKAYINNGWKLVMRTNGKEWELYHLEKDKNEHTNLAAAEPERLQQMKTAWEQWYENMKPYIKIRPGSGPR